MQSLSNNTSQVIFSSLWKCFSPSPFIHYFGSFSFPLLLKSKRSEKKLSNVNMSCLYIVFIFLFAVLRVRVCDCKFCVIFDGCKYLFASEAKGSFSTDSYARWLV